MYAFLRAERFQLGARVLVNSGALAGLRGTVVGITKHGSLVLEGDGLSNGVRIVLPGHAVETPRAREGPCELETPQPSRCRGRGRRVGESVSVN